MTLLSDLPLARSGGARCTNAVCDLVPGHDCNHAYNIDGVWYCAQDVGYSNFCGLPLGHEGDCGQTVKETEYQKIQRGAARLFEPIPYDPNLERELIGVQSSLLDCADQKTLDAAHDIRSKHYITVVRPDDATWIIEKIRDRITGRVVVEIGAGVGVLAAEMAKIARHVYAIEIDPAWTYLYTRYVYKAKRPNLTWIMDRAENLVGIIKADVAIVVTGSDEEALRALAGRFASEVFLPWQDWNDGKAVVAGWPRRADGALPLCECPHRGSINCAEADGLPEGTLCRLRHDPYAEAPAP